MSAQAVGGAVGHNEISIIIPCHRVVGTSGSLTGYAGGMDRKIALLKTEHVDMSRFFVPKKGTAPPATPGGGPSHVGGFERNALRPSHVDLDGGEKP